MLINRRGVLRKLGAGTVAAATPQLWSKSSFAKGQTITVTLYGGVYEDAMREIMIPEFERRTGDRANAQVGGPQQWLAQIEASRSKPPIDVIMNVPDLALIAIEKGLVEPMPVEKVPNLSDLPKQFTDWARGHGALFTYGAWGLAYHERLKTPPKSFAEFVEGTIAGKWRAALPNVGYQGTSQVLIWSLADALGGSVEKPDVAFDAIAKMKRNSVFWSGISDPLTLLESGEADISLYIDGRTWTAYDSGASWIRYVNPREGGVMLPQIAQKVKNGSDAAWDYINTILSPEPQSRLASRLNYGVSNGKVVYQEPLKTRVTRWEETRWPPFEKLGPVQPQWIDRWNREIRS